MVHAPKIASVLEQADDWKVEFDLELEDGSSSDGRPFPAEIATVTGVGSRPDGVIWSMSKHVVIWIELTSPWEENFTKRHFEKKAKYNQLAIDLRNGKHHDVKWTVYPFDVEVGARGAINEQPWVGMCRKLGFSAKERRELTEAAQVTAICCSFTIFVHRFRKWEHRFPLSAFNWSEASQ